MRGLFVGDAPGFSPGSLRMQCVETPDFNPGSSRKAQGARRTAHGDAPGRTDFVLLVKNPAPGAVKSRLAAVTGDARAAGLYRLFVLDMLASFEKASVSPVICFHPPKAAAAIREWLGPRYHFLAQRGDDHPARLRHAFEDLFAEGAGKVIVFASDLPDLPAKIIKQAGRELKKAGTVIGPCADGGYYAIGFRRESFVPEAFEGIAWSTVETLYQTVGTLVLAGHRPALLPEWPDIDTPEDLVGLYERNRRTAFRSSRTMEHLRGIYGRKRRKGGDAADG